MPRRLTIEEVKRTAKKRGGKCLSKNYTDAHTKLTWECSKNHRWEANANNIRSEKWCPTCASKIRSDKRRLSIKIMQSIAEEKGGKCLSSRYHGLDDVLQWKCEEGHIWKTAAKNIRKGHWCSTCAINKTKLTLEEMYKVAKERRGECLSSEYMNGETKLLWQCAKGHKWKASPAGVRISRSWCPKCGAHGLKKLVTPNIGHMKIIAIERGGKCLSDRYINAQTKLLWQCKIGHTWKAMPCNVKKRTWCPKCAGNKSPTLDEIKNIAKDKDGSCLSLKYVNKYTLLDWQCKEGHRWKAVLRKIKQGNWCLECASDIVSEKLTKKENFLDNTIPLVSSNSKQEVEWNS